MCLLYENLLNRAHRFCMLFHMWVWLNYKVDFKNSYLRDCQNQLVLGISQFQGHSPVHSECDLPGSPYLTLLEVRWKRGWRHSITNINNSAAGTLPTVDHIILAELSLPFFMPLNCNLCLGLPLACALRRALWGVTVIIDSPCPGLQFDRMQTQDWHHDLALSICEDLCKTDHEALTVLPRFSRPPTWPGPSGFSLTYTDSQANLGLR